MKERLNIINMKKLLLIICLVFQYNIYSQNFDTKDWTLFEEKDVTYYTVTKTEKFIIENLTFEIVWDKKLTPNEKFGYLGGIKSMRIYKDKKLINTILNITDEIGLGEIYFRFYDYNFDGYLDFTIPINEKWEKYYLFNSSINNFQNYKDWDYLKIQKVNKKDKLILSHPDGNSEIDSRKLYQIKGLKIFLNLY